MIPGKYLESGPYNGGFGDAKETFKAIREYEPDLSDEALENMVPPPKRLISVDTPLVDVT